MTLTMTDINDIKEL